MKKAAGIVAIVLILFLIQCEKIDHRRVPLVLTNAIGSISSTYAVAEGTLVDLGEEGISQHGHCWSTSENPTITDPKTTLGPKTNTGAFESSLSGLNAGTNYYVRAYAGSGETIIYGENKNFSTLTGSSTSPAAPTLTTSDPTSVMRFSAIGGGNITSDGGAEIVTRGICWNTEGDPVPETDPTSITDPGTGSYSCPMAELSELTEYYVRAFAENNAGHIGYGEDVVFTTTTFASVTTNDVSNIGSTTAACGGNVTSDGGTLILERGVCWGLNPSPTTDNYSVGDPAESGPYNYNIDIFQMATIYYLRAFARNINGTSYGQAVSFITKLEDTRDGKLYEVVKIGDQTWMAENLNHGESILLGDIQSDDGKTEKYCYADNASNCDTYGGIYTWDEMMQYSTAESAQGVCPSGWHIPSDTEWMELEMTLDMTTTEAEILDQDYYRGTDQGSQLKTSGTSHWNEPNDGTNSSGFSALPGGFSDASGPNYFGLGLYTTFWTSTQYQTGAIYRMLYHDQSGVKRTAGSIPNGTPVRCVKD